MEEINIKKPKFSILMASYNNGRFIEQAIKSVISQSYDNWELIIFDDGSNDKSLSIINNYLTDKRIVLITDNKNNGCGYAKNKAAQNSTGEIIGILDSDDLLAVNAIESIIDEYMKFPEYGCIYSNFYECDSQLNIKNISQWVGKINSESTNLFESRTSHFLTFKISEYKKTNGFDPEQESAVDKDIIYKLEEVTKFKFLNEPLYYYRIHQGGITYGRKSFKTAGFYALSKFKAYKRRIKSQSPNFSKKQIADITLEGAFKFIFAGEFKLFVKLYKESIILRPINFTGYFFVIIGILKEIKHHWWLYKNNL